MTSELHIRCDMKNSDRAFPVTAVTFFGRHVTKSPRSLAVDQNF